MQKLGRNHICSCGSGKKYKNCCGKNSVISIDSLIETELQELQFNLLDYALNNYQEEMEDYLEDCYDDLIIPDEGYEIFNFFGVTWFITSFRIDGKSILEEYVDKIMPKISRQRIKDILSTWKTARPSVLLIQQQSENQYLILEDIFTNVVHKVKVTEEDHIVETGGLVLGTLLPAGATSIFFTTFLDLPAQESEVMKVEVYELFEESGEEDPIDFMTTSFLEVLDIFIFGNSDVSLGIEDLDWNSPQQREVAEIYKDFMEDIGHPSMVISLGLFFWKTYCEQRTPSIKNPNVFGAALIYLVDKLVPFGGLLTQKRLAEEFEVNSGSISSRYKELEFVLSEEIADLQKTLDETEFDFDDFIDEDDEIDEDLFDEIELFNEDDFIDEDDIIDMDDFKKDK